MKPRIYLAGPDVFFANAKERGLALKELCEKYDLEGCFPLDNEINVQGKTPAEVAKTIFLANVDMIRSCDGTVANMTPFRGPSMDVGTAWEVGYSHAFGIPVVGYTPEPRLYTERVKDYRSLLVGNSQESAEMALSVESFGLIDNLMLDCSMEHVVIGTFEMALVKMRELL